MYKKQWLGAIPGELDRVAHVLPCRELLRVEKHNENIYDIKVSPLQCINSFYLDLKVNWLVAKWTNTDVSEEPMYKAK